MTEDEDSDPVVEVVRDNAVVTILFASKDQIKRIDAEEFIPLVPSFGLILYSFGTLLFLVLAAITFVYQAISDGLTLSDFSSAGTPLFIGLIILYIIIYQIASHVNILTGEEEGDDENDLFSVYQASTLTLLGIAFWIIAFILRIHFVPGIDADSYYSTILSNTAPAIGFLILSIAMDLIYIGMVLIGSGIFARGVYSLYGDRDDY